MTVSTSKTKNKSTAFKFLVTTMNGVNFLTALAGIVLSKVGFEFFQKLDLPEGLHIGTLTGWEALALGNFGLLVALLAFAGAYFLNKGTKNNRLTYFVVIVVATCLVLYVKSRLPQLETAVHRKMSFEYRNYYARDASKRIVDPFQYRYKCCGYEGMEDFPEWRWLPDSCCQIKSVKKEGRCLRDSAYSSPCKTKLSGQLGAYFYWLDSVSFVAGSSLIALVAILSIALVFLNQ